MKRMGNTSCRIPFCPIMRSATCLSTAFRPFGNSTPVSTRVTLHCPCIGPGKDTSSVPVPLGSGCSITSVLLPISPRLRLEGILGTSSATAARSAHAADNMLRCISFLTNLRRPSGSSMSPAACSRTTPSDVGRRWFRAEVWVNTLLAQNACCGGRKESETVRIKRSRSRDQLLPIMLLVSLRLFTLDSFSLLPLIPRPEVQKKKPKKNTNK